MREKQHEILFNHFKGQVAVPLEIRERLKQKPGDTMIYQDTREGILLKPAKRTMLDDFVGIEDARKLPPAKRAFA
jgi:AbrB family looped-hinge helix DNA binding protein